MIGEQHTLLIQHLNDVEERFESVCIIQVGRYVSYLLVDLRQG